MKISPLLFVLVILFSCSGCGVLKKREAPATAPSVQDMAANPLSQEEANELLAEVGENWLYGEGVGATTLNVATSVVFPPYAFYVLGNAILSVSGYEPVYITDALPEKEERAWNSFYSEVASVPGRTVAAVAREDFRTQEDVKESMRKYLDRDSSHDTLRLYLQEG